MRKLFFVLLIFLFAMQPATYADPWYDLGYNIGAALGNSSGQDDKSFYQSPTYDFSKIKKICFNTTVPNGFEQYVSDPFITETYIKNFKEKFSDTNIIVDSSAETINKFYAQDQSLSKLPQDMQIKEYTNFIHQNYQAVLYINLYAYYQNGPLGNVFMDFTLKNFQGEKPILYYKDMRMNAPRSTKEGMIKRITGAFKDKLTNAIKKEK